MRLTTGARGALHEEERDQQRGRIHAAGQQESLDAGNRAVRGRHDQRRGTGTVFAPDLRTSPQQGGNTPVMPTPGGEVQRRGPRLGLKVVDLSTSRDEQLGATCVAQLARQGER